MGEEKHSGKAGSWLESHVDIVDLELRRIVRTRCVSLRNCSQRVASKPLESI